MAAIDLGIERPEGASSVWVRRWRDFRAAYMTHGADIALCDTCARWRGAARGMYPVTCNVPGVCEHCAAGGGE